MLTVADTLRQFLLVALTVASVLILALFAFVLLQRGWREMAFRRLQRLRARYKPHTDRLLAADPDPALAATAAPPALLEAPRRHHLVIGDLLLAPLRVLTGDVVHRTRAAADALGLTDRWRAGLRDRRWWRRADSARALGLLRTPDAAEKLEALLDDPHEEVRAAVVEALGRLGDPAAVPWLLSRLHHQTRFQTARIVEALRAFGPPVTPALVAHANAAPEAAPMLIELLAAIGTPTAVPDLLSWSRDDRADVRAAAMHALGGLGIDERGYYHARRALDDEDARVRKAAGWALGRSGRQEAAPDLARHLADDWLVAATCATALRRLGAAGRLELERLRHGDSQAADLARQMLWERDAAARTTPDRAPAPASETPETPERLERHG